MHTLPSHPTLGEPQSFSRENANNAQRLLSIADNAQRLVSIADNAQRLVSIADNAQRLLSIADNAQRLLSIADNAQRLLSIADNAQRLLSIADNAQRLLSIADNAQRLLSIADNARRLLSIADNAQRLLSIAEFMSGRNTSHHIIKIIEVSCAVLVIIHFTSEEDCGSINVGGEVVKLIESGRQIIGRIFFFFNTACFCCCCFPVRLSKYIFYRSDVGGRAFMVKVKEMVTVKDYGFEPQFVQ